MEKIMTPIALFDSGIGGLSVLHQAQKILPHESFVYFADTACVPYGTKSKETVSLCVEKAVEQLATLPIKALVVACNTATSITIKPLRLKYDFPIIGMEPAVKPAIERNRLLNKRVLVLATPLTLQQDKYNSLVTELDREDVVDAFPLPELVQYCEQLTFDEDKISTYLREKLQNLDLSTYSTVVLGCTHYPYYKKIFKALMGSSVEIIDGNIGTVKHLKSILASAQLLATSKPSTTSEVTFLSSYDKVETARRCRKALHYLSAQQI
ncbi:MAG: glutamate racemase [Thermonemataceae bacterium]